MKKRFYKKSYNKFVKNGKEDAGEVGFEPHAKWRNLPQIPFSYAIPAL